MMPSRSPYASSSEAAVFSPTPATPGSPSEASPRMVAKSAYWLGRTRYFPTTTSSVTRSWLRTPRGDVEHPDAVPVVDQLEQVAVAGDHVDRHRGAGREGADHVVGLVAVGADDADAEGVEHLEDDRHLQLERVGHLLDVRLRTGPLGDDAVRLVRRDQVDAPLRAPVVVPRADQMRRPVVGHQPADEVEEAAHRVHRRAVGGEHLGHPEEGTEVHRRGVEDHQSLLVRHGARVCLMSGPRGPTGR